MEFPHLASEFIRWIEDERPDVVMNDGASADELLKISSRFPALKGSELLEWLAVANGEEWRDSSLCGGLRHFLTIDEILEAHEAFAGEFLRGEERGAERCYHSDSSTVKAVEWSVGWVPFFLDNAVPYCVDLDPTSIEGKGQIICCPRGSSDVLLVNRGLADFVRAIQAGVDSGQSWPYEGMFFKKSE